MRFDSNYTAYQLACQNSRHISAYQIPCYQVRVRMRNVRFDFYIGNIPEPFGPILQSFVWHSSNVMASFHFIDQHIVMRTL